MKYALLFFIGLSVILAVMLFRVSKGDLNLDGKINSFDISILISNYKE